MTRLGLQKLDQILRIPTDRGDGNLLRAQTAAAGIAVNAQLCAGETRMKQVRRRDVMERIIALMKEEQARMAEYERLELEGTVAARSGIVDPSTCTEGSGIMPAQDAND